MGQCLAPCILVRPAPPIPLYYFPRENKFHWPFNLPGGQHPSHNQSVWCVFPFKGEICQENTATSLLHRVLYFLSVNFYVVKIYGFSRPLFAQIDVYILSVCYLNTVLTLIPFTVVAPFLISVLLYFLMICISFLISHLLATQECS